jgi:hypothetical protein
MRAGAAAAQGRRHGKERAAEGGELADQQLALDLEPHHEEEERHQPVVHPV